MRVILSKDSKKKLLARLKEEYSCETLEELSKKLNIKKKTLENWFYLNNCTIPWNFFSKYSETIQILERREDNWGQRLGGKKGYNFLLNKYGKEKIIQMNAQGGKTTSKLRSTLDSKFNLDLSDPKFLEFYGALLGDGWMNNPSKNNKWGFGLCGNLKLDKEYLYYLKKNVLSLTNRKGYFMEKPKTNVIEFRFQHKKLFEILSKDLNFPVGTKKDLKIYSKIYSLPPEKLSFVIRGIFDTDGCFFLDRNKKGIPVYPCVSIHMKSPILIKQIGDSLLSNGFKFSYSDHGSLIKLSGKKQLSLWMEKIGSSNSRNLNKINNFLSQ